LKCFIILLRHFCFSFSSPRYLAQAFINSFVLAMFASTSSGIFHYHALLHFPDIRYDIYRNEYSYPCLFLHVRYLYKSCLQDILQHIYYNLHIHFIYPRHFIIPPLFFNIHSSSYLHVEVLWASFRVRQFEFPLF